MFYLNNDNYMQDLYYYNQMPNGTYMNGLGNNAIGNPNMQMTQQGGFNNLPNNQMYNNLGMFPNNIPIQNINNLYPSIYRILNPVISRVVLNNNQPITEDLLNNMTDTVINIVDGQLEFGDDKIQNNTNNQNQQSNANSSNNNTTNNSLSRSSESNRQNNQTTQTSNSRNSRNDSLLRDLIKILILKELLSRNQYQRQYRK